MMARAQLKTQPSAMAKRVHQCIRLQQLSVPGDHLLVGVSGGSDSLALLYILSELAPAWRWRLSVVHVNYGLRGEESDEDTAFVTALCRTMAIPLFSESIRLSRLSSCFDRSGARKAEGSLQARAREARYTVFLQVAKHAGADKVVLGHTADDQAETLLLWMLRGSGTTGLAGIPQIRDGVWIRPLLDVSRADLQAYLLGRGVHWRTDSTNSKPIYMRNRIRLQFLPLLKELNPAVVKALSRQAHILREEDRYLDVVTVGHLDRLFKEEPAGTYSVQREDMTSLPMALQRRVIRAMIRKVGGGVQGPAFASVEAVRRRVLDGRSGVMLNIAGGVVWRDYNRVMFRTSERSPWDLRRRDASLHRTEIHVEGGNDTVVPWERTGQVIRLRIMQASTLDEELMRAQGGRRAVLDADRIGGALAVRVWQQGDSFRPAGMRGRRKKLQDYFSDIKMPRGDRHRVPLLVAGDEILWVAGHRIDHRAQATDTSQRLLIADLEEAPKPGSMS